MSEPLVVSPSAIQSFFGVISRNRAARRETRPERLPFGKLDEEIAVVTLADDHIDTSCHEHARRTDFFVIMPPEPTVELDPEASAMISGVIEETSGMSVAVASSKAIRRKEPFDVGEDHAELGLH